MRSQFETPGILEFYWSDIWPFLEHDYHHVPSPSPFASHTSFYLTQSQPLFFIWMSSAVLSVKYILTRPFSACSICHSPSPTLAGLIHCQPVLQHDTRKEVRGFRRRWHRHPRQICQVPACLAFNARIARKELPHTFGVRPRACVKRRRLFQWFHVFIPHFSETSVVHIEATNADFYARTLE